MSQGLHLSYKTVSSGYKPASEDSWEINILMFWNTWGIELPTAFSFMFVELGYASIALLRLSWCLTSPVAWQETSDGDGMQRRINCVWYMHETNTEVQRKVSKVVALMLERHSTGARNRVLLYGAETSIVNEESSQGGLMPEDTIDRHFRWWFS